MTKLIKSKDYIGTKAWDALDIAIMNGITTRLHWTDKPYKWHINDGEEVFVVLDGVVEMNYKNDLEIKVETMNVGDIFYADSGTEHVAHPKGIARILVIETEKSL